MEYLLIGKIRGDSTWAKIRRELNARLILFEFKNYDTSDVGKEEVLQTKNYLTEPMGKLAIICSTKLPNNACTYKKEYYIFSRPNSNFIFD
ncbi:hypothetical protein ACT7DN_11260 [Bacillus paranthracis]